jgi:site-specific recombinase XerD
LPRRPRCCRSTRKPRESGTSRPTKTRPLAARFKRLAAQVKFPVTAYALRHAFATDKILEGVDLVTIATLMGHRDLKMLQKHYQNVKNRSEHLRKAVRKKDDQEAA